MTPDERMTDEGIARWNARCALGELAHDMNLPELGVMLYIAERIDTGRKEYGPLDPNDGRDWKEEAKQEMADWLVYRAIQELKR